MMLIEGRETTGMTGIDQGETEETGMIEEMIEEEIEGTEGVDPGQGTEVTGTGEKTDTDRVETDPETDPSPDLLTEEDEDMMMMIEEAVDYSSIIALLVASTASVD